MALLFSNNTKTTLASPINSSDTSLIVAAGSGSRFPSPTGSDYFLITLSDAATGLIYEICKCTSRSTDTLTIVRAQEGTTALSWASGSLVENRWTAGSATAMLQQGQSQSQSQNYGADTGTANAYVVALSPVLLAHTAGMPIRVKVANTSTGASTLNPGPGVKTVTHPNGAAIGNGDIVVGGIYEFVYDGTNYQLYQVPVMTGDTGSGGKQGLAPAPGAGDAAANKFFSADGTYKAVPSSSFNFVQSSGHYTHPSGMIENWARIFCNHDASVAVTWNLAFPTGTLNIQVTAENSDANIDNSGAVLAGSVSNSGCSVIRVSPTVSEEEDNYMWVRAIGY